MQLLKQYNSWCMRQFLLICVVSFFLQFPSVALETSGDIEDISYKIFAPSWTWQKRDINILVVLKNSGQDIRHVYVELNFPEDKSDHFDYDGDNRLDVSVIAGQTVRQAFTRIRARDRVPLQTYNFSLNIATEDDRVRVDYPVKTIRGAVVNPGKWALYLPASLTLLWSTVFFLVLRRYSEPGAWRKVGNLAEK